VEKPPKTMARLMRLNSGLPAVMGVWDMRVM
jgi:hypothetical protein